MPAVKKVRRRYSEKDLKKLLGSDYRTLGDKELLQAPRATLHEVLNGLEKKYPPRRKASNPSQELGKVRRELKKIQGQLSRIEKKLIHF